MVTLDKQIIDLRSRIRAHNSRREWGKVRALTERLKPIIVRKIKHELKIARASHDTR